MRKIKKFLAVLTVATLSVGCVSAFGCDNGNDGGADGDGKTEQIVLTKETDFAALISEKVTKEQWTAAFDNKNYNNCTIVVNDTEGAVRKSSVSGNDIRVHYYPTVNGEQMKEEETEKPINVYYKTEGGKRFYYYSEFDNFQDMRGWHEVSDTDDGSGFNSEIFDNFYISYKMFCPDFGKFYDSFEYNDGSGCYVLKEKVRTNSVLESWETSYTVAKVKIINGKLAYVTAKNGGGDSSNHEQPICFYDFGTTSFSMPDPDIFK